jgi:metal-sulfur cluster biosynthetic enzyme
MTAENQNSRPVWQIEKTHPDLVDSFIKAMREVADPEIGLDIIQLGLIRDLVIEENAANITMILTTPFCPYGPSLMESAREKAEKALGRPATVTYGEESWDFSMMEDGLGMDWGLY